VLVVGFVTAGVMTLSQSVGVIMGANVGSTFTAQVLAFDVSAYALAPIAIGFFMTLAGGGEHVRQYGAMILGLGLGLVFFGRGVMSDAMKPLRGYPPFVDFLASLQRPLFGVLAGALFTAVVQSSAATMGIAIALAARASWASAAASPWRSARTSAPAQPRYWQRRANRRRPCAPRSSISSSTCSAPRSGC
jgi:phosphate:Na+ symporter